MSADELVKLYFAIALAYLITRVMKIIRKKDGVSGWQNMKREAIKADLYMPEIFAALAIIALLFNAATWPLSLARMISHIKKPVGGKP